jgi:anti-sigma regulatory factor (Ser/Thr protein kinase)
MAFGQQVANRIDPPPDQALLDTVCIAAMEIAANITEHAYPTVDLQHTLQVDMALFPGHIELCFRDNGEPFDPAQLTSPCLPDPWERHQQGGWGLALAAQALDQLSYRREAEGINHWWLLKRLTLS